MTAAFNYSAAGFAGIESMAVRTYLAMRILSGADDLELAAEMYNFESGAKIMGPNLKRLPPPHEPCPMIDIAPATKDGQPLQIHYRPALGIVFYVQRSGRSVEKMAQGIATLLESLDYKYLTAYRATASTPAAVMRRKKITVAETTFSASRSISSLRAPPCVTALPARLVCCCDYEGELPPCTSYGAAFTWVFLPVDSVFDIAKLKVDDRNAEDFTNASLASIVYDAPCLLREGMREELQFITAQDFKKVHEESDTTVDIQKVCGASTDGALILQQGRLRFTGRWVATCRTSEAEKNGHPLLSAEHWPSSALQCTLCDAPLCGEAMVLRGASNPTAHFHTAWFQLQKDDDQILNNGNDIILCGDCRISQSCASHISGTLFRCIVPLTQAEICARLPKYKALIPLLEGKVRQFDEIKGAFIVEYNGIKIVIIGAAKGAHPAIRFEAVASHQGQVIPLLNIIEAVGDS